MIKPKVVLGGGSALTVRMAISLEIKLALSM